MPKYRTYHYCHTCKEEPLRIHKYLSLYFCLPCLNKLKQRTKHLKNPAEIIAVARRTQLDKQPPTPKVKLQPRRSWSYLPPREN